MMTETQKTPLVVHVDWNGNTGLWEVEFDNIDDDSNVPRFWSETDTIGDEGITALESMGVTVIRKYASSGGDAKLAQTEFSMVFADRNEDSGDPWYWCDTQGLCVDVEHHTLEFHTITSSDPMMGPTSAPFPSIELEIDFRSAAEAESFAAIVEDVVSGGDGGECLVHGGHIDVVSSTCEHGVYLEIATHGVTWPAVFSKSMAAAFSSDLRTMAARMADNVVAFKDNESG